MSDKSVSPDPAGAPKSDANGPGVPGPSTKMADPARSRSTSEHAKSKPSPAGTNKPKSSSKGPATKTRSSVKSSEDDSDIRLMLQQVLAAQNAMSEKVDIMWHAGAPDQTDEDYDYEAPLEKRPRLDDFSDYDSVSEGPQSAFAGFSDILKQSEKKAPPVDSHLAELVNGLFSDGLSDEDFKEFCKVYQRPENCRFLTPVKMNQLIWDIVSAKSQAMDVKLQTVQTSLAKAAICLTKLATAMPDQKDLVGEVVNALGLLGHGFHNLCLRRRDLLKPDLKTDFLHLCSPSVPYTDYLFGDDVEKRVKDIREVNLVSSKIRGATRTRGTGWRWPGGRGRGSRPLNSRPARFAGGSGPYQHGFPKNKWSGKGHAQTKAKTPDK